jgi:hypothetical protein
MDKSFVLEIIVISWNSRSEFPRKGETLLNFHPFNLSIYDRSPNIAILAPLYMCFLGLRDSLLLVFIVFADLGRNSAIYQLFDCSRSSGFRGIWEWL